MFEKKGQIIISKEECEMDADDLMMMALDAGAEDFNEEDDSFEALTTPEDFQCSQRSFREGRNSYGRCQCHNDPWYYG